MKSVAFLLLLTMMVCTLAGCIPSNLSKCNKYIHNSNSYWISDDPSVIFDGDSTSNGTMIASIRVGNRMLTCDVDTGYGGEMWFCQYTIIDHVIIGEESPVLFVGQLRRVKKDSFDLDLTPYFKYAESETIDGRPYMNIWGNQYRTIHFTRVPKNGDGTAVSPTK